MISPETIAIVGVAALIIFGPKKLPELGKSLGQGIREFKRGTDGLKSEFEQGLHPDQAAQQQQITTQTAQAVPVAAMTTQATQGQTVYPQVPQTQAQQPQAPQTVPTELVVQAVPQSDHEPLKS